MGKKTKWEYGFEIKGPFPVYKLWLFYQHHEGNLAEIYEADTWHTHPLYDGHWHSGYDAGVIYLTQESSDRWRKRHDHQPGMRGIRQCPLDDITKPLHGTEAYKNYKDE